MSSSAAVPVPLQTFGSMMLRLDHKRRKLAKESAELSKSRQRLHASKTKLYDRIAEFKKYEKMVTKDKENCLSKVQKLQREITDAGIYCNDNPTDKTVFAILKKTPWTKVNIPHKLRQNRTIERELKTCKNLITPEAEKHELEPLPTIQLTGASVKLFNIDAHGVIDKNGSISVESVKKCCFCSNNDINTILLKCQHECCCFACANEKIKNGRCPMCYEPILKIQRTFKV